MSVTREILKKISPDWRKNMPIEENQNSQTALLFVDPYNDFLSPGGKLYPLAKEVAESVDLLAHLREMVSAARQANIRIFFVPHHRWEPGDYTTWKYPSPSQRTSMKRETFAKGSWGGEFHSDFPVQKGDIVIKEHWAQNGFVNTDLDLLLKQHGIQRLVLIGMIANTCIEATGRFGMELGYHVTLVKDATAAFSQEAMHAAHEMNGPTFAHAILTTSEAVALFRSFEKK
jgi:nicotinamidase-related amidase